jgi:hypothetical protein
MESDLKDIKFLLQKIVDEKRIKWVPMKMTLLN